LFVLGPCLRSIPVEFPSSTYHVQNVHSHRLGRCGISQRPLMWWKADENADWGAGDKRKVTPKWEKSAFELKGR
jgi:hypothetical protein